MKVDDADARAAAAAALFSDDESGSGDSDDSEGKEKVIEEFYCVACEKPFKSEKQYVGKSGS